MSHDGTSLKDTAERRGPTLWQHKQNLKSHSHSTVGDNATAGFFSQVEGLKLAWNGMLDNEKGKEIVLDQNRE